LHCGGEKGDRKGKDIKIILICFWSRKGEGKCLSRNPTIKPAHFDLLAKNKNNNIRICKGTAAVLPTPGQKGLLADQPKNSQPQILSGSTEFESRHFCGLWSKCLPDGNTGGKLLTSIGCYFAWIFGFFLAFINLEMISALDFQRIKDQCTTCILLN
jgi:hypothetical protein